MDGKFTGHVIGTDIVDAGSKANTLPSSGAEAYDIPLAQTVAINATALTICHDPKRQGGVPFHAKPKVNEKTEITIRHADLMGVFSGSMEPEMINLPNGKGDRRPDKASAPSGNSVNEEGKTWQKLPNAPLFCNECGADYALAGAMQRLPYANTITEGAPCRIADGGA